MAERFNGKCRLGVRANKSKRISNEGRTKDIPKPGICRSRGTGAAASQRTVLVALKSGRAGGGMSKLGDRESLKSEQARRARSRRRILV